MNKYTVQKGDTLAAIGRKYGVSYMDIAKENNISNPDQIYEGQTLQISMPANTGSNTSGRADTVTPATTINKGTAPAAKPVTSPGGVTYGDFSYADFNPMDDPVIQQAYAALEQHNANKPGAWVDPYQSQYMGFLNQYENRDPFSYDFNSDALYQQYKDSYIQQGQMAMMDTMGQAAAMTGGYGNSYAQTVGQQVYNQQLSQLNDIMPELYGMAYDRYQQEGQEMLDMYSLYKGLSDQSFDRYQGELDNWYREDARLTDNYNTLYERDHGDWELGYSTAWDEYLTGRSEQFTTGENDKNRQWQTEEAEKDRQHQTAENDKSRAETQKSNAKSDLIDLITGTGYEPTDSELAAAGMTREQAKSYAKAYSDSQGSTGGGNPGTTYTLLTYEEQKKWEKDFEKATKASDLERIGDRMEQAGVDPAVVASWVDYYKGLLFPSSPQPGNTPKPTTGGSGSGTMYWEAK